MIFVILWLLMRKTFRSGNIRCILKHRSCCPLYLFLAEKARKRMPLPSGLRAKAWFLSVGFSQLMQSKPNPEYKTFPVFRKPSCHPRQAILNAGNLPALEQHPFLKPGKLPATRGKLSWKQETFPLSSDVLSWKQESLRQPAASSHKQKNNELRFSLCRNQQ